MLVTLTFTNRDAGEDGPPVVSTMQVSREAVPAIMDWYGAYYAGDDYDVRVNGRRVPMGINGELEVPTIDAEPARVPARIARGSRR